MLFVFLVLFLVLLLFVSFLVWLKTGGRFLKDLRDLHIFEV